MASKARTILNKERALTTSSATVRIEAGLLLARPKNTSFEPRAWTSVRESLVLCRLRVAAAGSTSGSHLAFCRARISPSDKEAGLAGLLQERPCNQEVAMTTTKNTPTLDKEVSMGYR